MLLTFNINAKTSDSIIIIGTIAKAVDVSFVDEIVDLGDMQSAKEARFVIQANTDYKLSTNTSGKLINKNGNTIGFNNKITQDRVIITPNLKNNQTSGNYSADLTISISAI
jgi:hypothetical protein